MAREGRRTSLRQIGKFCIIGVGSTIVNYAIFWLLLLFNLNYLLAMTTGFLCGTSISYKLNKSWTFASRNVKSQLHHYLTLYLCSLLVGALCITVMVENFLIEPSIANILTICITASINFFGSKFGVFRDAR